MNTVTVYKCKNCEARVYGVGGEENHVFETIVKAAVKPVLRHTCQTMPGSRMECEFCGVQAVAGDKLPPLESLVYPARYQIIVTDNLTDPTKPLFEIWRCRVYGEVRQAPTMLSTAILADSFLEACRKALGNSFDPSYTEPGGIPHWSGARLYPTAAEAAAGNE